MMRYLIGIEYEPSSAFPADDTGYGFDVIGDVLNISPLLMEKYVEAAQAIIAKTLPSEIDLTPAIVIYGDNLRDSKDSKRRGKSMPFAEPVTVSRKENRVHARPYQVMLEL